MKKHVQYSRRRDQLYHYKVGVRMHHEDIPVPRRTPELVQLMEMVETLVETVCLACENDQVVAMQLDCYDVLELPGFGELFSDMKNDP